MTGVTLFQAVPCYKPKATAKQIAFLQNNHCRIVLDLEDSIQDVQSPELTPLLKNTARKDLEEIISMFPTSKFGLRVNSVWSEEFMHDQVVLDRVRDNIDAVFIPKVERSKDIDAFYSNISKSQKINLIIESQTGIDNIEEILSTPFINNIDFVLFGNYDYHLSINSYPIVEQNAPEYWETTEPLIRKIESFNIKFGNSPYANIADTETLAYALMRLTNFCNLPFALFSLHKSQTVHINMLLNSLRTTAENQQCHAKEFRLADFVRHKQKGRSFSFGNGRIITPQEYLLALKNGNG